MTQKTLYRALDLYKHLDPAWRPALDNWLQQVQIHSPGTIAGQGTGLILDRTAAEFEISAYNWDEAALKEQALAWLDGLEVITEADIAYMQETADAVDAALQQDVALWEADDAIPFDSVPSGLSVPGVQATARAPGAVLYGEVTSFSVDHDLARMDRQGIEWVLQQARIFDLGAVAVGVLRHYGCSVPVLVCGPEEAVGSGLRLHRAVELVQAIEMEMERLAAWESALDS